MNLYNSSYFCHLLKHTLKRIVYKDSWIDDFIRIFLGAISCFAPHYFFEIKWCIFSCFMLMYLDDQTNIDKYRLAENITEYHIISKLILQQIIITNFCGLGLYSTSPPSPTFIITVCARDWRKKGKVRSLESNEICQSNKTRRAISNNH